MNSNCEISREETDQQEEAQDDDTFGTKRSYECTFCRRGFTNAQALGGHMNIHRKERAKDKQVTLNSSLPHKYFTNEESTTTPPFASGFSNQSTRHYSILESQRNYDMHFHPPPALNLRHQPAYAHVFQHEFHHDPRFRPTNLNQELRDANLSLQIGPSHVDNNAHDKDRKGAQKDNEVDLELRLGHHPY